MSVEKRLFLGIKQMTKSAFSELQDSEKVGYLWFVRCENPTHFEIYLGTKKYGETNETLEQLIREIAEKLRVAIGLNEDLTLPEDFQYTDLIAALNDYGIRISDIEEKIVGLFKFKGVFDTLTELFNYGEQVEGYVYQVRYRDVEQDEHGQWVPVNPPILINSEFVWNGSEWVELGPIFDERQLDEIREVLSSHTEEINTLFNVTSAHTENINELYSVTSSHTEDIRTLFEITSEHTECLDSMNVISDEFIRSLFFGELRELVINIIGGEVLSKTGEGEYHPGTVVRIGVEPADGYSFIEWNDGNTNQYRRVSVADSDSGNTYVAILASEEQTGTIIPLVVPGQENMGHVEGGGTGVIGGFVSIEAFRNGKTEFVHWLNENGDIVSVENPYSVEIISTGITNFYAEFQQISFDVILNNLNDFSETPNYRNNWSSDTISGITYTTTGTHRSVPNNNFYVTSQINNKRGWGYELDPITQEPIHYENLLYPGEEGEKNITFVMCGIDSNNWNSYQKDGVISVYGNDGLDSVRFNYGYGYKVNTVDENGIIANIHLLVKIYSGHVETNENLVAIFKIQKEFNDWGYIDEEEKILQRPFLFDSMSGYDYKNEQICGKLNIEGDYLVTIRNYFSQTDLVKNSGETPEEYYGDDTFDEYVKLEEGKIIVAPLVRLSVDNIEVSLVEDKRNGGAVPKNKKGEKQ